MDEPELRAYLDRIGAERPALLDAGALAALHRAHLLTVPIENLSNHLAEPISLDEGGLLAKIVTKRRGGFCYELNGAFALLLEALGARVTRVAARVYGGEGKLGPRPALPGRPALRAGARRPRRARSRSRPAVW